MNPELNYLKMEFNHYVSKKNKFFIIVLGISTILFIVGVIFLSLFIYVAMVGGTLVDLYLKIGGFSIALFLGFFVKSGGLGDVREFYNFKKILNIMDDTWKIVWVYKTTTYSMMGIKNKLVYCDYEGHYYSINFGKNEAEREKIYDFSYAVFETCIFKHYLGEKLDLLYKKNPETFYLYAKYLTMPLHQLPEITLAEARASGGKSTLKFDIQEYHRLQLECTPADKKYIFMLGCGARYVFSESAYDIYCRTKDLLPYQHNMRSFQTEIFYSLDDLASRSPKLVRNELKKAAKDMLLNDWGIQSKRDLIYHLESLLHTRNHHFNMNQLNDLKHLYPNVKTLVGFNIARYVNLVKNGFASDYITNIDEVHQLLDKSYDYFITCFKNYDDFVESYLVGVYNWNKSAYTDALKACCYVYQNPYSPWNQLKLEI